MEPLRSTSSQSNILRAFKEPRLKKNFMKTSKIASKSSNFIFKIAKFASLGMPAIGGFCAFLYSAIFHEYMWWFNFRENYRFGENLVFFLTMYFICAGEAQIAKSKFGNVDIPKRFRNAVVAFVCIYSSRFVTASCHRTDSFADIGNYFPRIVYHPTGAHGLLALP